MQTGGSAGISPEFAVVIWREHPHPPALNQPINVPHRQHPEIYEWNAFILHPLLPSGCKTQPSEGIT
jgi:hypothetical protein